MNQPKTRIPTPIYAAAGVGVLAYQQLRKLPAVVTDLGGRAALSTAELREKAVTSTAELREKAVISTAELREKAALTAAELRERATTGANTLRERAVAGTSELDLDRLRAAAIRNAAVVVTRAQAAQERASAAYNALILRGEQVVGKGVVQAADTVNADMDATEPLAVEAEPVTPAVVAEKVEAPLTTQAKRVTRNRPTAAGAPTAEAPAEAAVAESTAAAAEPTAVAEPVKPKKAVRATRRTRPTTAE